MSYVLINIKLVLLVCEYTTSTINDLRIFKVKIIVAMKRKLNALIIIVFTCRMYRLEFITYGRPLTKA